VEVDGHPLDYGDFEGTIPRGEYGGGTVQLWDRGYWEPEGTKTPEQALAGGDFKFALAGQRLQGGVLHPQHVARAVSELASGDATFTCDLGLPTVWAARYLAMNGRRRLLGSFWHGSMADALPQAIGAQAAFPQRQVVSLSGDGSFSMLWAIC